MLRASLEIPSSILKPLLARNPHEVPNKLQQTAQPDEQNPAPVGMEAIGINQVERNGLDPSVCTPQENPRRTPNTTGKWEPFGKAFHKGGVGSLSNLAWSIV